MDGHIPPYAPERYEKRKESVRKMEHWIKVLSMIIPVIFALAASFLPGIFIINVHGAIQKDFLLILIIAVVLFFTLIVTAGFLHIVYIRRLHEYLVAKEPDPEKRVELYMKYNK
ncbi:MAG: hypothetical protein K6A77_09625 [Clostridiales bacterium]|nr:hypothetical protein [Clostridiales bacterium]